MGELDSAFHSGEKSLTGKLDDVRRLYLDVMKRCLLNLIYSKHEQKIKPFDELRIDGEIVTEESYLIVEDTNVNGHPVFQLHGPGPMEAVEQCLRETDQFAADREREKFLHHL